MNQPITGGGPEAGNRLVQASGQSSYTSNNDEIDLRELFATLWAGRWVIVSITMLFTAIAVVAVLLIPNQYKATAVLAPASGNNAGGLSSQLSGLASLAGVTLGNTDNDESQIAMEVMQSWAFIDRFIKENGLEVDVFAADGWDGESNQLHLNDDIYNATTKKWVRPPPKGKTVEPTSWELFDKFSDQLSVSQDKKTGLVSISVEFYSPVVAKHWVDLLVAAINEHMRIRKLDASNKNIAYLQEQVDKTPVAEMKSVFYQLIENETKNKMLAEASPEYQFVTVSPAMVPEQKSRPKRLLIVVLTAVLGGAVSVFFVLARKAYSTRKNQTS